MTWWETADWACYEALCGCPGQRQRELEHADWQTRVIDLRLSPMELRAAFRSSYKALVSQCRRDDTIHMSLSFGEPTTICHEVCSTIHYTKIGRATRPFTTWVLMDEWVAQKKAQILVFKRQAPGSSYLRPIGYMYCVVYGAWAYYFSGQTLEKNISHYLVWLSMLALKARGVTYFELGWMDRPGDDQKAKNISFFKSGFGGTVIPAAEAPKLCGL